MKIAIENKQRIHDVLLTDMFAITTIFAFGYALLMLGSILGLS